MTLLTRRTALAATLGAGLAARIEAHAQQPQPAKPGPATQQAPRFGFDDVLRRARELSKAPFDAPTGKLPAGLSELDFDAWRDIRFRPEKSFFAKDSQFRLQLFHVGYIYRKPVTINIVRDGLAAPIPYSANLFDYGHNKIEHPFPVNTGFAGFRIHYPLNDPHTQDELCAFLGASYFRFLSRGQRYGLSARALAVAQGGNQEEFPFFREFWIETPDARADHISIYGLVDGASVTGAFRFDCIPGRDTAMDVQATIFPRRNGVKFGLAPLTSMFFLSENDRKGNIEYRAELHDSDGLLIDNASGEWLWRPLRNPSWAAITTFMADEARGFGLMQRDRDFGHYQDLDLAYEMRPSYWIEPRENFGEGVVELIELPTVDETNDNIVASFVPKAPPEAGKPFAYSYRIVSTLDQERLSPNGRAVNTFQTTARALGSSEKDNAAARRFIIDFAGGDLAYYAADISLVTAVASISQGSVIRSFVMPNPYLKGVRAIVDVQTAPGQTGDIRVFLRSNSKTLTETWTYPWAAPVPK